MAGIEYIVTFYIEWNDGNATSRTLQLRPNHLIELFDQLYEKVVIGSIADAELYDTGMINEITIDIMKKPNGRLKNKLPE